ncbi:MAG: hypothetical protein BWY78_00513 [Alphaproteobacteria bacterium ADurb.Bin438]|nr:MAG: hypothetical protein BWY78_00513 [Alphaproteobacteria bacterium ADurb.Bin438]
MTDYFNENYLEPYEAEIIFDIQKSLNHALDYILYRLNDLRGVNFQNIKQCEIEFKNYFDYIEKDVVKGAVLHFIKNKLS